MGSSFPQVKDFCSLEKLTHMKELLGRSELKLIKNYVLRFT